MFSGEGRDEKKGSSVVMYIDQKILICGSRVVNWSFLQAGMIDELGRKSSRGYIKECGKNG